MSTALNNDRERVLQATDLVRLIGEHVTLKRSGREHVCICPFHDDHSPSMHVVTHKGTPFYKCFACGASGTAIDFVMHYHKMPFIDALRFLADRASIDLAPRRSDQAAADGPSRTDIVRANDLARHFFRDTLNHAELGRAARDVIEKRGITPLMVEQFGLGAAPNDWEALGNWARRNRHDGRAFRAAGLVKDRSSGTGLRDTFVNRLTFPIGDQMGRTIAFGGRVLNPEDQPKYLNSPESAVFQKSRTLYGVHLAADSIRKHGEAIVTEGYMDVIAMHQHGFTNVVATLGTALSDDHAALLQRLCDRVTLLFDGDEAGQKAADRAVEMFFSRPIEVRICVLPGGCDPDDLLRTPGGSERMTSLLAQATDALAFVVRRFKTGLDGASSLSARQRHIEDLLARLADLGLASMSGLRKRMILPALSDLLRIPMADLAGMIPKQARRPIGASSPTASAPSPTLNAGMVMEAKSAAALSPAGRARRVAEEALLAVMLFEPSVRFERVDAGDGHMLSVGEAYGPECFADPACRAIYGAMHEFLESGAPFDPPTIQALVVDAGLARMVMDLYDRGRMLCGEREEDAARVWRDASKRFDQIRDREARRTEHDALRAAIPDPERPATRTLTLMQRTIEERRRHGDDRAALPRGVRS
jgi:DNA primase